MTDATPDPAASALDGIRETLHVAKEQGFAEWDDAYLPSALYRHTASLAAAVEAALKRHVQAVIEDGAPPVYPFRYCRTCSGHPAWPCPEVAAITAELAGAQLGEDGDRDR